MRNHRIPLRLAWLLVFATGAASAGESVARWVDEDGVTHFGDRQVAPPGARIQAVGPANGMDVPENARAVLDRSSASGPSWSLIDRAPKQNPKGWRTKGERARNGPISPHR